MHKCHHPKVFQLGLTVTGASVSFGLTFWTVVLILPRLRMPRWKVLHRKKRRRKKKRRKR